MAAERDRDDQKHLSPSSTSESAPIRRPYVAPELRRLGSVRDLSLALSGGPMEGLAGGMMNM